MPKDVREAREDGLRSRKDEANQEEEKAIPKNGENEDFDGSLSFLVEFVRLFNSLIHIIWIL